MTSQIHLPEDTIILLDAISVVLIEKNITLNDWKQYSNRLNNGSSLKQLLGSAESKLLNLERLLTLNKEEQRGSLREKA